MVGGRSGRPYTTENRDGCWLWGAHHAPPGGHPLTNPMMDNTPPFRPVDASTSQESQVW
jgi:hypothetical protein